MSQLAPLFAEAGTLMLTGMIFVFVFLGLLIIFINTVLAKLAKIYPDKVIVRTPRAKQLKKNDQSSIPTATVAAISAAVTRYRQQHSAKTNK